MILVKFLVIFSAFQIAIAQRYNVCGDSGLRLVYMDGELGWVGIGWAWTQDMGQLRKVDLDLEYESSIEPDPNNLGKLQILNMIPLNDPKNEKFLNMVYEFNLASQEQIPDITKIVWKGVTLCDLNVTKPYLVKMHAEYNYYTKERTLTTEVVNRFKSKPTVAPVQLIASTEDYDDSETVGCGKVDTTNIYVPLVLEGQTIERGQWPWLVSVYSYSNLKLGFRCGATLISNKLVVTAAHCFFDVNNRQVKSDDVLIILGQYNLKRPQDKVTKIVYPQSVNIHPDYQKLNKIDSDIAIVVIPERVRFTTYIRPACLWKGPETKTSLVGKTGFIAGWGRDENGNFFTVLPKQSKIPVVSDETCLRSNEAFVKITSEVTFCAGWRNGTEGPCNGDSGGPFVFEKDGRWTLRGVVSTSLLTDGGNTCNLNEYVVFTDVSQFTDWITSFDTDYTY
ncbi:coagulation factor IX-like isoform X3 [Lutzomyia longipalpis]|uniref:coagulation factor IX-like isoform X3 n=1 Tax=Lutzomyia longipalpis TaxID=7200 RepID=UPI002484351B|nr:coagulation factor IX-like isoform X3 [Lutzomyia longipalpis]